jgi:hypothetical protein
MLTAANARGSNVGFVNKYALAIKLVAFGLLIIGLFAMKAQNASLHGKLDVAAQQIADITATNAANVATINQLAQRQIDNDAIAAAVTKRLETNRAHTEGQRQAIRNANNDPTVRNWADTAVPNSLRGILEGNGSRANDAPGGRTKR